MFAFAHCDGKPYPIRSWEKRRTVLASRDKETARTIFA